MMEKQAVEIVDVAPRDGFQAVTTWIPTETKVRIVRGLVGAGLKRIETGAFVSPKAIPQMQDTAAVHSTVQSLLGQNASIRLSTLVPNLRGASDAVECGVADLVYVLSVSESHNQSNVRRPVDASLKDLSEVLALGQGSPDFKLRVNLATVFDCPYEGRVERDAVAKIIDTIADIQMPIEIGLCDTTGRAFPDQVASVFEYCLDRFEGSDLSWCFHGHDTYGMGLSNALYAYQSGVRIFDAASAGLGGCPFAPGASGNTATEDLVFTFHNMGINSGIDLEKLLEIADDITALPDIATGGHIRGLPRSRAI